MDDSVTFRSSRFKPVLPEESQVNPGRYGAELAFWLCSELAQDGIVTSYPNYEDWGWFLEYVTSDGEEFWLCCGNTDGKDDEWQCFLKPLARGLFRSKADIEHAKPLLDGLKRVLERSEGISDIEWEKGE